MGLKPTTSPSILFLQGEEVPIDHKSNKQLTNCQRKLLNKKKEEANFRPIVEATIAAPTCKQKASTLSLDLKTYILNFIQQKISVSTMNKRIQRAFTST
jgi:hypothetical protein